MKTVFLPREVHETYFMQTGPHRPKAKEIAAYLSAHHPLYGPECRVDSRRCRIAGEDFFLLTVLSSPVHAVRSGLCGTKFVTVSAILASSRFAKEPCTVRCGTELVVLGSKTDSRPPDALHENSRPVDHEFATEADLLAFATREKIQVSLFPSRWHIPASIMTALLCLLLSAFMASPTSDSVPIQAGLVTGTIPVLTGPSFSETFAIIMEETVKSGGVIEEYRFSINDRSRTTVAMKKGNPDLFRAALGSSLRTVSSVDDLTIQDLRYEDATWRYQASFSLAVAGTTAGSDEPIDTVTMIRALEQLCRLEKWQLALTAKGDSRKISFTIPSSSFPLFPAALFAHCSRNALKITSFHVMKKDGNGAFIVELELDTAGAGKVPVLPKGETVTAAFGLNLSSPGTLARPSAKSRSGIMGTITDSSKGIFVFGKTPAGKVTVQKEAVQ